MEVCRLCMSYSNPTNDLNDENIYNQIRECLRLEIDLKDKRLPSTICLVCARNVRKFHRFGRECWKTQRLLKDDGFVKVEKVSNLRLSLEGNASLDDCGKLQYQPVKREMIIKLEEISVPLSLATDSRRDPEERSQTTEIGPNMELIKPLPSPTEADHFIQECKMESQVQIDFEIEFLDSDSLGQKYMPNLEEHVPFRSSCTPDNTKLCTTSRKPMTGKALYRSLLMECTTCGKMIERNRMEGHTNKHKGIRPYACGTDGCEATFHCKHARRLHIRCRHGNESFPCEACGKAYKARRDLLGHIRECHSEPRFECDLCPKKFTTRSRMNQHRDYHIGNRKHACTVCPMRFYNKFQLRVHTRIHTGAKPFACRMCSQFFTYRHMAKEHIARFHGVKRTVDKEWIIHFPEPSITDDINFKGPC
ncbi:zinc finger protein 568-like [Anopheles cruzii]|uniref:zinc finger protein 568-like n=1 Tax=Anopheles cruzii TaxID=68878 RepID=UPI0022EC34B9|nr:zinc finger protein 568-like [Anopheles cruzii]